MEINSIPKNRAISVVIPIYNEADSIQPTLSSLTRILGSLDIKYEIVAVNDGSKDRTIEILNNIEIPHLRVIDRQVNRGYGASLKIGIKEAIYEYILITDADGTYPIDQIPRLIEEMDKYDMVVGSRNGKNVKKSLPRKIGRELVRLFACYVSESKIVDINSGLRIFKKSLALKFWHLFPERFSFTSTISVAMHSMKYSVKYVSIDYHTRVGKSSIRPVQDFIGFISLISRIAIYFKPLRVFVPISLLLLAASFVVLFGSQMFLDRTLDSTFAIFVVASLQTLFFGLIADMIVKHFYKD